MCLAQQIIAQDHDQHTGHENAIVTDIEAQPLLAQAMRLKEALSFLGSSMSPRDENKLSALQQKKPTQETVRQVQQILDPYCLAIVNINPEARVKVEKGPAEATLIQGGWTSFLVKVNNRAGVTSPLEAESPNSLSPVHVSSGQHNVQQEHTISEGESINRFLDIHMYRNKPLKTNLSGIKLEYAVVQIYSKDAGRREAEIGFNVGQGSEDISFRNTTHILFNVKPSVKLIFNVKDEDGSPAMGSFVITDSVDRKPGRLSNVYPLPSRRVAAYDDYPDFFFQKQVYRKDGESVNLAPGRYTIIYTRGPEYIPQTKEITVPAKRDSFHVSFQLKRWINMSKLGWYSGDHHVHAAGCSHYDSPEEGVPPRDMLRQALGEDLNVSAVLTWGPSWYYQKRYFTGRDDSLSTLKNIMRYDVEVSGFPSSHSGHIVLLRLKEDDFPGTTKVEEWPSWTLPVLQWARSQGSVVGYAHSGWGLEPVKPTDSLPNYELPKMDGIGANEYVVAVTKNLVDIFSAGNTPITWELNMWYHTLNCGFRTRVSGETDFPCITDYRVGLIRSYYKSEKQVNYDEYVKALKDGLSYVSDGGSHLMNFSVNGKEAGRDNSEIKLNGKQTLNISADVAAYLPEERTDSSINIKALLKNRYYWHIEMARIADTRKVGVELLVNGVVADTTEIIADGKVNKVSFKYDIGKSSWIALRIFGSSHSNPLFIEIDGKPIYEKKSAEWCRRAVDQCWKMKEPNIRNDEKKAAKAAYDEARNIYDNIIKQSAN